MYMDDEFIAQKCLRICIYRFEVLGIQYKTNTTLNDQTFFVCSPKDGDEEPENRPIL